MITHVVQNNYTHHPDTLLGIPLISELKWCMEGDECHPG